MTAKKPTPKPAPPSGLYRLAEIVQMRRVDKYGLYGVLSGYHFECNLCLGRMAVVGGEIEHKEHCPISKLKDASL